MHSTNQLYCMALTCIIIHLYLHFYHSSDKSLETSRADLEVEASCTSPF